MSRRTQQGFTAVELLVTLFVAAAFLIAGYQLFSVVIRDGGQTRAEAQASSTAYDYLQRYSSSATSPCTSSTPLDDSSITVAGLVSVTVTVAVTCPQNDTGISKITATVRYNNPQQTISYSTLVNGTLSTNTITNGLIGWWRLNGLPNDSIGSSNGTVFGAVPTTGQNGLPNTAFSFNGVDNYIRIDNAPAVGNLTGNLTITAWIQSPLNTSSIFSAARISSANGIAFSTQSTGTIRFTTLGVRDYSSSTATYTANTWHFVAATMNTNTVTYFVNGVQRDTISHTVGGNINIDDPHYIGAGTVSGSSALTTPFNGKIDDLRIYNRVLALNEIQTLYNGGAF